MYLTAMCLKWCAHQQSNLQPSRSLLPTFLNPAHQFFLQFLPLLVFFLLPHLPLTALLLPPLSQSQPLSLTNLISASSTPADKEPVLDHASPTSFGTIKLLSPSYPVTTTFKLSRFKFRPKLEKTDFRSKELVFQIVTVSLSIMLS
jgi:hypothetical protein